jgi:hypothetical protein
MRLWQGVLGFLVLAAALFTISGTASAAPAPSSHGAMLASDASPAGPPWPKPAPGTPPWQTPPWQTPPWQTPPWQVQHPA